MLPNNSTLKTYSNMRTPQVSSRMNNILGSKSRKQQSVERYNKKTSPSRYHIHCTDGNDRSRSTRIATGLDTNTWMSSSPNRVDAAFDSQEWSSTHMKQKLLSIESYLDVDKLV